MKNKILTLLGFAAKAGKLSFGFEASVWSLKTKKAKLAVVAEDISQKSRKESEFFAGKNNIKLIVLNGIDMKTVSDAVGRKCGIISVNDHGFADAILKAYDEYAKEFEGGNADDE